MHLIKDNIKLRGLEVDDVEGDYYNWLSEREVNKYFGISKTISHTIESMREWVRNTNNDPNVRSFAIEIDSNFVGTCRVDIDWVWRVGMISVMIGDKDYWSKGHGTKIIGLLSFFAFNDLNLHKLEAGVLSINEHSVRAFENNGFQKEGVLRDNRFCEGRYVNVIKLGLVNDST